MSSTVSVLVTSPPTQSLNVQSAINFIKNANKSNMKVDNVFFYMDGVHNANNYSRVPSDEFNALQAWKLINSVLQVPLLVCITAAEKRGIINEQLREQYELKGANLIAPFKQVGLGDFFERLHDVDRLVQF